MQDRTLLTRNLNYALIAISTVILLVRLNVRLFMIKSPGLDDVFAVAAWATLVTLSSLEIFETFHGSGKQMVLVGQQDLAIFFSILPTMQLLYIASSGLVRLSIVAFLPRLNKEAFFKKIVHALGGLIAAVTTVCFLILLFECQHVPDLWNKRRLGAQCLAPSREAILMYTHTSFGILFDCLLLALPIWVLYSKMMFNSQSLRVMLVFTVGIFAAITGIVRLAVIVRINMTINTTFNISIASFWTDLEGHVGLWVACFPALQPLLRLVSFKLGLRSRLRFSSKRGNSDQARKNINRSAYEKGPNLGTRSTQSPHGRANSIWSEIRITAMPDIQPVEMDHLPARASLRSPDGSVGSDRRPPSRGIVVTTDVLHEIEPWGTADPEAEGKAQDRKEAWLTV
ncbi:hypothetical protein BU16DRAFT_467053 [Lophium mytilinum]|uniref:Rhodopsin domain-containing protein n=1 Tax=Lophium mytilinum TaxID=390894 RepID=A0A6A6QIU3_9PEZI|nr:hypothetical protein BU16DRAFT_467053 [Lophium mytilinum]